MVIEAPELIIIKTIMIMEFKGVPKI